MRSRMDAADKNLARKNDALSFPLNVVKIRRGMHVWPECLCNGSEPSGKEPYVAI